MNCKSGDLAILIKSQAGNEGKICNVLHFVGENPVINGELFCYGHGPCWMVEYASITRYGYGDPRKTGPCPDAWLRPVSGLPDEQTTDEELKQPA